MNSNRTVDIKAIAQAIQRVQSSIQWKPGRAAQHLLKRKRQGHLSPETTLTEYEALIVGVLRHPNAFVYIYRFGESDYPTG